MLISNFKPNLVDNVHERPGAVLALHYTKASFSIILDSDIMGPLYVKTLEKDALFLTARNKAVQRIGFHYRIRDSS